MPYSECLEQYPLEARCADALFDRPAPPYGSCVEGGNCILFGATLAEENCRASAPCSFGGDQCDRATGYIGDMPTWDPNGQPYFCLVFSDDTFDVHRLEDPFWIRTLGDGEYRYFLGNRVILGIEPCAGHTRQGQPIHNYCDGDYWAIALSRWFVMDEWNAKWKMGCNEWEFNVASQLTPRWVEIAIGGGFWQIARLHVWACAGGLHKPYAFYPYADTYCFTKSTEDTADGDWANVGSSGQGQLQVDALDSLRVHMNLRLSDDAATYPHRNPYEVILKNAALAMLLYPRDDGSAWLLDRLDDAHTPTAKYDSQDLCKWYHHETFDENNLTLESLGLEPYPAVRGVRAGDADWPAGLYPEFTGQPIPLTCRSWLTGIEIPATLTLYTCTVVLHLHVEARFGATSARLSGSAWVGLILRVKLGELPENYPYTMTNPDDPYDLTVDQDGELLTALGPNGEPVPRIIHWRGLNTHRRFSRSPHTWVASQGTWSDAHCCRVLHAINSGFLYAELNDCTEYDPPAATRLKEQWQQGGIGLEVPWITEGNCRT